MNTAIYLTLHQTARAVAACVVAGRTPLVFGSPGIAKTTLIRQIAPALRRILGFSDWSVISCILSNMEAVDVGGLPVVTHDGHAERKLFGGLREAAEVGGLLLLDEFTTCPPPVQGPAMGVTLEHRAGDTPLHDRTRVVCLANPPDQAPGGLQLTATLVNRVVMLHCRPTVAEVAAYFAGAPAADLTSQMDLVDPVTWRAQRAEIMRAASIIFETRPDLLCFDPPAAAISDGEPFGSPRAWEACCEVLAALPALDGNDPVVQALAVGAVGAGAAIPFLSTLRAREHLPTVEQVLANPLTAKLPIDARLPQVVDNTVDDAEPAVTVLKTKVTGRDVLFASIPLTVEVARTDTYAAILYAQRLPAEIKAALTRTLAGSIVVPSGGSPWMASGSEALMSIIQEVKGIPKHAN